MVFFYYRFRSNNKISKCITLIKQFIFFKNIKADFQSNINEWKKVYDSLEPHLETFPAPWNENLNYFRKCLVLRLLRYDKIIPALQHFVAREST